MMLTLLSAEAGPDYKDVPLQGELMIAARNGDVDQARRLLKEGADINGKYFGRTALVLAIWYRQTEMVKFLLKQGADPNLEASPEHGTPLSLAVNAEQRDILQMLFDHGLKLNTKGSPGKSPFLQAITERSKPNLDLLKWYLDHGARRHATTYEGDTALHLAVRRYDYGLIDLLIRNGLDIDARNSRGQTPLILVSTNKNKKAEQFIQAGANVHIPDNLGGTPLHYAARDFNRELVQSLIDHGADVNARDIFGRSPLYWVTRRYSWPDPPKGKTTYYGHDGVRKNAKVTISEREKSMIEAVTEVLKAHGAKIHGPKGTEDPPVSYPYLRDSKIIDHQCFLQQKGRPTASKPLEGFQTTPLHLAVQSGNINRVRELLKQKAEVNARDETRRTPLHYSSQNGHMKIMSLLIKYGAKVNVLDEFKRSPLHWAAGMCHAGTIKALLFQKADVNVKDLNGNTPLHIATQKRHSEISAILFERGADVKIKNKKGQMPILNVLEGGDVGLLTSFLKTISKEELGNLPQLLFRAAARGDDAIVKVLLEQGADPNGKFSRYIGGHYKPNYDYVERPLHQAVQAGNLRAVQLLVEYGADVNAENSYGHTPLYDAIYAANEDIARYLGEQGSEVNGREEDRRNVPPDLAGNG